MADGLPGRPPFVPTKAQKDKVALLAVDLGEEAIARQMKFSRETLRKYFAEELKHGRDDFRALALRKLKELVTAGNMSAIKEALKVTGADAGLTQDPDLVDAATKAAAPEAHPEPKPPKLGKKELAQIEALSAGEGSEWGEDLKVGGALPN